VKVTCSVKKISGQDENGAYSYDEYTITKIEMLLEKNDFKTATCIAYDYTGALIYVVETILFFKIRNGRKKMKEKVYKNKAEICVKGNICVKAAV